MRNRLYYLSFFLAILNFSCSYKKTDFVIRNVSLFDGENYKENITLTIRNGVISDLANDSQNSSDAIIIDGKGKTIIPPLLNAHVHTWQINSLEDAIRSGVFALFDMHSTDESARMLREYRDSVGYAFYYSSGPGATVPGGHGTQYGITFPTINDSVSSKQFVEDRINHNSDYIKILREPSMKTINFLQTKEVINTAHEHSKLCVAHVSRLEDGIELANQKIDGFVHIWDDHIINEAQLDSLKKEKIFIVPTLLVIKKLLESERFKKYKNTLAFKDILNETKKVYEKGIPILAGTDAPNFNLNYGDALFEELKLLSQAGISNIEVLKASTSNIYKAFRLKEFGVLKNGSPASFILLDGNPINNIEDLNNNKITGIWQKGYRIK